MLGKRLLKRCIGNLTRMVVEVSFVRDILFALSACSYEYTHAMRLTQIVG